MKEFLNKVVLLCKKFYWQAEEYQENYSNKIHKLKKVLRDTTKFWNFKA